MNDQLQTVVRSRESIISTHKVLRNTYLLLSLTLLFSAATAGAAMMMNFTGFNILMTLGGIYGLMFLTHALRNSAWGILSVFAFTGFMGLTLGPLLNMYIHTYANGSELIMTALGATGVIFFSLSAYVTTTRKDFSFLGGFLFVGVMCALLAMLASVFFNIPGLHLAISGAFVLIASGLILFETSQIIHGGQTNYILATVSLYVSIYNLFVSLLHIFGSFSGRD